MVVAQLVTGIPAESHVIAIPEALHQRIQVFLALGIFKSDPDAVLPCPLYKLAVIGKALLGGIETASEADPGVHDQNRDLIFMAVLQCPEKFLLGRSGSLFIRVPHCLCPTERSVKRLDLKTAFLGGAYDDAKLGAPTGRNGFKSDLPEHSDKLR